MKPFSKESLFYATLLATSLAVRGSKKKSLSKSGAIAGFVVGFLSIACGWRGMLVIVFYQVREDKRVRFRFYLYAIYPYATADFSCSICSLDLGQRNLRNISKSASILPLLWHPHEVLLKCWVVP